MKITDLKVYLTRPKSSTRSWLFVEIDTDEGITGTGESTNSGGGGALVLAHTYNMMKNDLEGQDFSEGLICLSVYVQNKVHTRTLCHKKRDNCTFIPMFGSKVLQGSFKRRAASLRLSCHYR